MLIKSLTITIAAGLLFVPALHAITLNGQDIATYGKLGEPIVYRDKNAANITIRIKNGDILIGSIAIPKMQVEDIIDFYMNLEKHKDALSRNVSKHALTTSSQNNIYAHLTYMASDTAIVLQTNSLIDMKESLFRAPEVAMVGNYLRFEKSFISTKLLQLEPANSDSIISMIIFVFDEKAPIPACIEGHIDFINDNTINDLVVLGAREVGIIFRPEAFDRTNKKIGHNAR